ncbi:MAG: nucleotidyl transferase AbiEii/AbiGii toxin family protein [Planctomycetes bacterium]|nr:nucleotidyl transferase AbiEii/AbiGii toxin family protein [Planctomycetota bacterium]
MRDAGGPLIETTMALFGSHMSNGSSHVTANLPFVLAGGTALGLRHGSHIDFNTIGNPQFTYDLDNERSRERFDRICRVPVNSRAPHSNLLLTMAQKMGARIDRFNNSTGTIADVVR